jgi:hypothetical protein
MPIKMHRRAFLAGAPLVLAACSGQSVWAPDDVVNNAIYRSEEPTSLTLFTTKNLGSENGAHTSLLVNGSQRVLFDPAGSFTHPVIPERNDVLFGMTDDLKNYYIDFHSRKGYFLVAQKVFVSPELAEMALRTVMQYGAVSKTGCTRATSSILQQLPGFEGIGKTWFPNKLEDDFAEIPGVMTPEFHEDPAIIAARAAATAGR